LAIVRLALVQVDSKKIFDFGLAYHEMDKGSAFIRAYQIQTVLLCEGMDRVDGFRRGPVGCFELLPG